MAATAAAPASNPFPPTTSPPPESFFSRTAQIRHSISSSLRPWRQFLDISALSLPVSFSEATFRLRINLYHFRFNYSIIALLVLFLSLIYHPVSIIVFLITLVAWLYLYFSRDEPLTVLNRTIDDRVVLVVLGVVTIFALILTSVWWNIFASMMISAGVICLHAVFRAPDDFDDQESPYGGLLSVVDDSPGGAYSQV